MNTKTGLVALGMIAVAFTASGCVSSTLDSSQFRAVGETESSARAESPQASGEAVTSQSLQPVELNQQTPRISQSTDPQPSGVASDEQVSGPDPAARANAVAEMRAKAAAGSGQKTQIGAVPEPATKALTAQEQSQKLRELNASASSDVISDSELAAKQQSIDLMRKKAKRHYKDALSRIER